MDLSEDDAFGVPGVSFDVKPRPLCHSSYVLKNTSYSTLGFGD